MRAEFQRRAIISILIALALSYAACTGLHKAEEIFTDVDGFAAEAPDSVLAVLRQVPRRALYYPPARARYALLYTQAQDRCGIAVDNDSLIRYAAHFYGIFGPSLPRFYAYYYLGQVRQNAGNREGAMEAYVKAERIHSRQVPDIFRYALYANKSEIYSNIFDRKRALEENLTSNYYARRSGRPNALFNSLLNTSIFYYNLGDYVRAQAYVDSLSPYMGQVSVKNQSEYASMRAQLMLKNGNTPQEVVSYMDSIRLSLTGEENLPWARWVRCYTRCSHPDRAMETLEQVRERDRTAAYYSVLSETLDSLHRPQESLEAYRNYVKLSDSLDMVLFRQDTRFIEERYAHRAWRVRMLLLLVGLTALLALLFIVIIKRVRRHHRLRDMYDSLKAEYADIQGVMQASSDSGMLAQDLLRERMRALAAFFTKEQPSSLSRVSSRLETLTANRKELIDTIGLLFGVYHPAFVSMLLEHGLTVSEVGFCCLHVLGLRTVEIGDVINRSGYYNISLEIRRKLPIEGEKLPTWLKEQFARMCP